MKYFVHSDPAIDRLQIHSESHASDFFSRWNGQLYSLRFEPVTLSSGAIAWGIDCILFEAQRTELFTLLATLVLDDRVVRFPSLFARCRPASQDALAEVILTHLNGNPAPNEIFDFHVSQAPFTAKQLTRGRAVPGLCEYVTAVQHIRRYVFASARLYAGRVLDCACGTGYGAGILGANAGVSRYTGVDVDAAALEFARAHNRSQNTDFQHTWLEEFRSSPFENVTSLETMEHVPDPHRFMEQLIEKLAPGGQLILSMPAEPWAGSHLNAAHLTNWDFRRFKRLVNSYFEHSAIFKQQLSLSTPLAFERSIIYDRPPNAGLDENFLAILRGPKNNLRRRIVVRRDHALGDTILATPIVRSLKQEWPDHDLVFVTKHTQVFQANPFVDIVVTPQFQPGPHDEVIDLNGAYEANRNLHILEAYSKAANRSLPHCRPELFPSPAHYQWIGRKVLAQWKSADIRRILVIHPQASSPDRIWPAHRWQEFLSLALAGDRTGLIVVGSGHDYDLDTLDLIAEPIALSLVNQTDLLGTAAAIDIADVLVAPDSGLMHVASAMGTLTIGLFGMANPDTRVSLTSAALPIWSPIGCRGCLSQIPPEAPPLCKFGHSTCMDKIEASVVFQRYEQALAGRSPYAWLRKLNCVGFDLAIPDGAEGRNIPGRRQAYDNSSSIVRRFLKIAKNVGR